MFTALLDTCVLWPSLQRDFLLSLAVEGMYRPAWSTAILEELETHETHELVQRGTAQEVAAERAGRLITQMRASFDDAETHGWEPLEGSYGLPDPDDEHVVAAAVVAGAGAIITHNLKDFPAARMPGALEVLQPAEFAMTTVSLDPARALRAVAVIAARSGRRGAAVSTGDVLDLLHARYGMSRAVELLREVHAGR